MAIKKNTWKIKEHIYKWLTRIGIHEGNINILSSLDNKEQATVKYAYNRESYSVSTSKKKTYSDNLHNVELLIHSRVLGIERGIESVEQAFAGYVALPDKTNESPFDILGLHKNSSLEDCQTRYKQLSKIYHPDVNSGESTEFIRLKRAIEEIKSGFVN